MVAVYFLAITLLCLVPFAIAISYFVMGLSNYITGRKENNRVKIAGGTHGAIVSFMAMVLVFFVWAWLCRAFLSWEFF